MVQDKRECSPIKGGVGFGEGQGFAHKTRQALTQGVVPAFLMGSFARGFAHRSMLFRGQDGLISTLGVTAKGALSVLGWNTLPQLLTGGSIIRANEKGDDLACATAQRRPQPAFARRSVTHKRPHFIQLQYILYLHRQQALDQQRYPVDMFQQPAADGLPMPPTLQSAQTDTFRTRSQNRRFLLWRVACFRLQHPINATVFTMVLCIATFIRTILDYICTATGTTGMGDDLSYHVAHFVPSSLTIQPIPTFLTYCCVHSSVSTQNTLFLLYHSPETKEEPPIGDSSGEITILMITRSFRKLARTSLI